MSNNAYVDIHCHIIPGVDDGSASFEESLEMIDQAYREGIRGIVATPHYGMTNTNYDKAVMLSNLKSLIKKASHKYPDLKFVTGNEIYYRPGIIGEIINKNALSLGDSSYYLVEFDVEVSLDTIMECIQEFTSMGYRPIIAHPERYIALQDKWKEARKMVEHGAYMQINARSIMIKKKSKRKKTALMLLEHDLVHFMGSDAHDSSRRTPIMESAVKELRALIGDKRTEKITKTNILKLIRNEFI